MTTIEHPDIPAARNLAYLFKGQAFHLAALVTLLAVAYAFAAPAFGDQTWLGLTAQDWFWLNAALVVVHQVIVWLVFRGQLGWQVMTKLFGRADMVVWGAIFLPFLAARPLVILGVVLADPGSLALPKGVAVTIGLALCVPALFAMYSVARYFGIPRALGGDHFREHYRQMPLVSGGAYRFTDNAMYGHIFLGLWAIAFLAGSQVALAAALFQHAYIWIHYVATEKPDMDLLYAGNLEKAA
ncbi:MAG: hypothetical protein HQ495_08870 [Alphaproteobacteria bacterium]|nr:hypothetical protein [Alphaproteobacteria bacterium]